MAVSLSVFDKFAIPALPPVIVTVKLEAQFLEPLDLLIAQQTFPIPFPLITNPFAELWVP
jgi:hypothetical protein